jgi:UDP-hydrolysing UDP-N-acetyl-D-glucosamine 2-epimerase
VRRIALVTVGRSDYGLYLPLLRRLQGDAAFEPLVVVGGAHLSPEHGLTVRRIEADGVAIAWRAEMLQPGDTAASTAASMARGTAAFAAAFEAIRPDLVVVLGDRFEMHAAVVAAVPFRLPVAHIHGGELTEGAIDDAFRHSMTKLSHLHFVATEQYEQRVRQMGEEPWRVTIVGALSLDNVRTLERPGRDIFLARYDLDATRPFVLVTLHPTTLDAQLPEEQVRTLLAALDDLDADVVFTQPNADAGGRVIEERLIAYCAAHSERTRYVPDFGPRDYLTAMECASAMVGNSSSGIIEAASFGLPVVNVGSRQDGRIRGRNVIDVRFEVESIRAALRLALSPPFRLESQTVTNPYGGGHAAERIADVLGRVAPGERLLRKRFIDLPLAVARPPQDRS